MRFLLSRTRPNTKMIDLPTTHPQTITVGPPVVYNENAVWFFIILFRTHKSVVEEAGYPCDNTEEIQSSVVKLEVSTWADWENSPRVALNPAWKETSLVDPSNPQPPLTSTPACTLYHTRSDSPAQLHVCSPIRTSLASSPFKPTSLLLELDMMVEGTEYVAGRPHCQIKTMKSACLRGCQVKRLST